MNRRPLPKSRSPARRNPTVSAAGPHQLFTPPVAPEGPHFVYDVGPELFLGRAGRGPLEVVWDTNILIDYFTHGAQMWEGEALLVEDEDYEAELHALQMVLNLWVLRDIHFHVLDRSVTDAKKELSEQRQHRRRRAIEELAEALRYDIWADEPQAEAWPEVTGDLQTPLFPMPDLAAGLPEGADRELVREAIAMNAHVFLTRDEGVLRHKTAMAQHQLLIASPLDLLEELTACGAMHCILKPGMSYWPIPDLQRIVHLINIVGYSEDS